MADSVSDSLFEKLQAEIKHGVDDCLTSEEIISNVRRVLGCVVDEPVNKIGSVHYKDNNATLKKFEQDVFANLKAVAFGTTLNIECGINSISWDARTAGVRLTPSVVKMILARVEGCFPQIQKDSSPRPVLDMLRNTLQTVAVMIEDEHIAHAITDTDADKTLQDIVNEALDFSKHYSVTCGAHKKPDGRWGCVECDRSWSLKPKCARDSDFKKLAYIQELCSKSMGHGASTEHETLNNIYRIVNFAVNQRGYVHEGDPIPNETDHSAYRKLDSDPYDFYRHGSLYVYDATSRTFDPVCILVEDCTTAIASFIIGPRFPVPNGSDYTLEELQEVRWARATTAEKADALGAAEAIVQYLRGLGSLYKSKANEVSVMYCFEKHQAVCVGGRWDGWVFVRNTEQGWVSKYKTTQETPLTIPPGFPGLGE